MLSALGGCFSVPFIDDEPEVPLGTVGYVSGFYGGAAADEPRAALAGRDALTSGGSAADAATAMYFTMAVTMPSAAGFGGGGICVVRDPTTHRVETLDFLGQPSSGPGDKVLVPGNARGIFALHAKFGKLKWAELIRPAENLARFGTRVSRAFGENAKLAIGRVSPQPSAIVSANGDLPREGESLKQPELAAFMARLRSHGPAAIHVGAGADRFADDVRRAGFGLTASDLKALQPLWRSTLRIPFLDILSMHFPMPRTPSGTLGAKVAAILIDDDRYEEAAASERGHLIAEAAQRAIVDGANGFQEITIEREFDYRSRGRKQLSITYTQIVDDYIEKLMSGYRADRLAELAVASGPGVFSGNQGGETSFSAMDINGGAVACTFSMNGAFGTGRTVPGSGFYLANHAASPAARDLSMGAVIVDHNFRNHLYMVGTATGGTSSQAVLAQLAVSTTFGQQPSLEAEVDRRERVFRDPVRRVTYVEDGVSSAFSNDLKRRGHRLISLPGLARVNIAYCPAGIPGEKIACSIRTDPRGFGFAATPG
ncbi:MAG: hypothetical protein HOH04_03535 [Rhodospirillaceae bacterium]|nr:hypothetical protein [Rhodospirillaceae bacterium]